MNTKELKYLAINRAYGKLADAIMALPDDPHQEHEDLVKMAREYLRRLPHATGAPLAEAVIARLDKREVPDPALGSPECWGAIHRRVAILESKLTRRARLTGTEEV